MNVNYTLIKFLEITLIVFLLLMDEETSTIISWEETIAHHEEVSAEPPTNPVTDPFYILITNFHSPILS